MYLCEYACACVHIYICLSRIYLVYILKISSCLSTIFSMFGVSFDFGLSHQDKQMHEEYTGLYLSEVYIYCLLFYIIHLFLMLTIYDDTKTFKKQDTCSLLCLQIAVPVQTNCIVVFIKIFMQNTTRWRQFYSCLELQ